MSSLAPSPDVSAGRLEPSEYREKFADLHPRQSAAHAAVEADRCYFCHDAPCMEACPTGIDIPLFIREIASGNAIGAAATILGENIFGGMCARVCPTETLCEQVCVRAEAGETPVAIGRLQRFATDALFDAGTQLFNRGRDTGRKVAVVGAGPAGLACAHALACAGHAVKVFEARPKAGGLNEYGIAAYKTVDDFAQAEVAYIMAIGGISIDYGAALGRDISLDQLREQYDAVFLGMGLGATNKLRLDGAAAERCIDAVDYIAGLRQADDLAALPVGRRIVVIGGGMTAIDVAVQTAKLGAAEISIVYRRGPEQMGASDYEQSLARAHGARIVHWASPTSVRPAAVGFEVEFARTQLNADGRLVNTDDTFTLAADQVFHAIGQRLVSAPVAELLELANGKIAVDEQRRTSLGDVWAGGDCINAGADLTVSAVQDGKLAARAMDTYLRNLP